MYKITSQTKSLRGEIILPFSKSESNRALIIQHLTSQPFTIRNLSNADDTVILQQLLESNQPVLNCGDGGTTFRFLLAYLAFKGEDKIITGSDRLCSRPVKPLVEALNKLGASITSLEKEGFPPLKIGKGDFSKVNSINITAAISSQFISALLMIAPVLPQGLNIKLEGKILSKPYLYLTLKMMNLCGIDYSFDENTIHIKQEQYKPNDITIGADWSAASYFYEIAALADEADILLSGLNLQSNQGDKVVAELMKQFGIESVQENNGVRIIKNKSAQRLQSFDYDFSDCPDLSLTFAFLCAALNIQATLSGLDNLSIKETNRTLALQNEIAKLGNHTKLNNNTLSIFKNLNPVNHIPLFKSYNDHRMIMAAVPLALSFSAISIDGVDEVSKSFPEFFNEMSKTGFMFSREEE